MAGQRAARYVDIPFAPGFFTNETDRGAVNRWKDGNKVRFHRGLPEKFGGFTYIPLDGVNAGKYYGVARALHDWASLDGQQWISIGTNCKLHLVNNARIYDITPTRKASAAADPFSMTSGSNEVEVTDPDHRAEPGDHVRFFGATSVGGLVLSGDYEVASVIDVDTFTILAASDATSTATGGGEVTIEYDISCGLSSNGELLGYGTGDYGEGTYGTPRAAGTGVRTKLRTWSFDNWGEDLVGSPSGGGLYWWDRTTGPNSRATHIPEAPSQIQRILVNPENRILIALGCTSLGGQPDKMLVRWCNQEDFTDWIPSATNIAGGKRLDYGSEIITGLRSRGQNLIWTDTQLYAMEFLGDADIVFGFRPLGACSIMGPNAAIDLDGVVYFMGVDDFFVYDGTLRPMPCDVHTYVFGDFDREQADKVVCSTYRRKGEIRWDYPSASGDGENDRYVIYNRNENCWYYGQISRTAYRDVSKAIDGSMTHPYGVANGNLYKHEYGVDEVDLGSQFLTTEGGDFILTEDGEFIILEEEAPYTQVMSWFLQSHDVHIQGSDAHFLINSMVPDYDLLSGSHFLELVKKPYPRAVGTTKGPYTIDESTLVVDVRARSSQISMKLYNGTALGQNFRMGTWQVLQTRYGGR